MNSPYINVEKENVLDCLIKMCLDEKIRGEKLSINQLIELSNILETE